MNIRERAEQFATFVGLELKGRITTQGFTAKDVAIAIGRQPAAFNRWLNGKVEIPISVVGEACEYINYEPARIVEDAYARLAFEYGERDGSLYTESGVVEGAGEAVIGEPDASRNLTHGDFARNVPASLDDLEMRRPRTMDRRKIAADDLEPRETDQDAPGEHPEDR